MLSVSPFRTNVLHFILTHPLEIFKGADILYICSVHFFIKIFIFGNQQTKKVKE